MSKPGKTSLTPLIAMLAKPRAAAKVESTGALALIKQAHATGGTQLHTADPGRRRRFYKV